MQQISLFNSKPLLSEPARMDVVDIHSEDAALIEVTVHQQTQILISRDAVVPAMLYWLQKNDVTLAVILKATSVISPECILDLLRHSTNTLCSALTELLAREKDRRRTG